MWDFKKKDTSTWAPPFVHPSSTSTFLFLFVTRHTQAPPPRAPQGSILGLDKLAAQQRAAKQAAALEGVAGRRGVANSASATSRSGALSFAEQDAGGERGPDEDGFAMGSSGSAGDGERGLKEARWVWFGFGWVWVGLIWVGLG